jgi:hypothetical protein
MMNMECVSCSVEIDFLNIIQMQILFEWVKLLVTGLNCLKFVVWIEQGGVSLSVIRFHYQKRVLL